MALGLRYGSIGHDYLGKSGGCLGDVHGVLLGHGGQVVHYRLVESMPEFMGESGDIVHGARERHEDTRLLLFGEGSAKSAGTFPWSVLGLYPTLGKAGRSEICHGRVDAAELLDDKGSRLVKRHLPVPLGAGGRDIVPAEQSGAEELFLAL